MNKYDYDPTEGCAWDPIENQFLKPDGDSDQWRVVNLPWRGLEYMESYKYDPNRHPLFEEAYQSRKNMLQGKYRQEAINQAMGHYNSGQLDRVQEVFNQYNQKYNLAPKTNGYMYVDGKRLMEWDEKEAEREYLEQMLPGRLLSRDDPNRYAFEENDMYWGMNDESDKLRMNLRMGITTPEQAFLRPKYDQKEKEYMDELLEKYSHLEELTPEEMLNRNRLELYNLALSNRQEPLFNFSNDEDSGYMNNQAYRSNLLQYTNNPGSLFDGFYRESEHPSPNDYWHRLGNSQLEAEPRTASQMNIPYIKNSQK